MKKKTSREGTPLVIVKDQSSHLVFPIICTKQQTCENLGSIGHRSCEKMMKEKNTRVGRICVLSDRNKRLLARSLLLF